MEHKITHSLNKSEHWFCHRPTVSQEELISPFKNQLFIQLSVLPKCYVTSWATQGGRSAAALHDAAKNKPPARMWLPGAGELLLAQRHLSASCHELSFYIYEKVPRHSRHYVRSSAWKRIMPLSVFCSSLLNVIALGQVSRCRALARRGPAQTQSAFPSCSCECLLCHEIFWILDVLVNCLNKYFHFLLVNARAKVATKNGLG